MAAIAGWIISICSHSDASAHDEPTDGHDEHHAPKLEEIHESPLTMLVPLGVLALGAVFAGMVFVHYFIGDGAHRLLARLAVRGQPAGEGELPLWVELAPLDRHHHRLR